MEFRFSFLCFVCPFKETFFLLTILKNHSDLFDFFFFFRIFKHFHEEKRLATSKEITFYSNLETYWLRPLKKSLLNLIFSRSATLVNLIKAGSQSNFVNWTYCFSVKIIVRQGLFFVLWRTQLLEKVVQKNQNTRKHLIPKYSVQLLKMKEDKQIC